MDFDREIENQRIKIDPQEGKVHFICNRCMKEIYEGQEYYSYERNNLCEECFDEIQDDERFRCKRIAGEKYE